MKHCSLFCAGPWPILFLPLLLLVPVLYFTWHSIESLVAGNVERRVKEGFSWAKVDTFNRGRDVLIAGQAPNQNAISEVLAQAKLADGASSVTFVGDVAPKKLQQPSFKLVQENGELLLSGKVNSLETSNRLTNTVKRAFKDAVIRNKLELSSEVGELQKMSDVILAFSKIKKAGAIDLTEEKLTLTGFVSNLDEKELISSIAALQYSGFVENRLEIAVPCQQQIQALLDESKINFSSGNAEIDHASDELLSRIASAAKECPTTTFEVVGHTDSMGNPDFNRNLSRRRAEAVVAMLESFGLDKNRFSTKGAGASEPIADNTTEAGRAKNRRFEFRKTN